MKKPTKTRPNIISLSLIIMAPICGMLTSCGSSNGSDSNSPSIVYSAKDSTLASNALSLKSIGSEFRKNNNLIAFNCYSFGKYSYQLELETNRMDTVSRQGSDVWLAQYTQNSERYQKSLKVLFGQDTQSCPFFAAEHNSQAWRRDILTVNSMLDQITQGAQYGFLVYNTQKYPNPLGKIADVAGRLNAQVKVLEQNLQNLMNLKTTDQQTLNYQNGSFLFQIAQMQTQFNDASNNEFTLAASASDSLATKKITTQTLQELTKIDNLVQTNALDNPVFLAKELGKLERLSDQLSKTP